MKIGLIIYNLAVRGGTQRQLLALGHELKKLGHEVKVYTFNFIPHLTYSELLEGMEVVSLSEYNPRTDEAEDPKKILGIIPYPSYLIWWQKRNRGARRLAHMIDKDTDLLNPHGFHAYTVSYYFRKDIRPVPSVYMLNTFPLKTWEQKKNQHVDPLRTRSLLKQFFYYLMDRIEIYRFIRPHVILVLGNGHKEYVRKYIGKEAVVVRSGLYPEQFTYAEKHPPRNRRVKILLSGILFSYRRFEDAIEAVKILTDGGYDISITHIGSRDIHPEYYEKLLKLIQAYGLQDRVTFKGTFPDDQWIRHYQESDVAIFPNCFQPWLIAVFESMACGTPVIVSKDSGAHEVLTDRVNAMLVNPMAPQEIANALQTLIDNPELYRTIAKNGRKFVEENISWSKYANAVLKVFQTVRKNNSTV